jgi:hypothetical protein
VWMVEMDSSGSGQGPVVGPCEHGNGPLDSTKGRAFADQLGNY